MKPILSMLRCILLHSQLIDTSLVLPYGCGNMFSRCTCHDRQNYIQSETLHLFSEVLGVQCFGFLEDNGNKRVLQAFLPRPVLLLPSAGLEVKKTLSSFVPHISFSLSIFLWPEHNYGLNPSQIIAHFLSWPNRFIVHILFSQPAH